MAKSVQATFIEPMECLPVTKVPEGRDWTYEVKLDGYRLEAVKRKEVTLYSRRSDILNDRFPYIASTLQYLPEDTVVDGELVALTAGRPQHADGRGDVEERPLCRETSSTQE